MKNFLSFLAIASVTGLAVTITVETAGLFVPSALAYATPFAVFVCSLVMLTFTNDYRTPRRTFEPHVKRALLFPANEAFVARPTRHHQAPVRWTARHRRMRRSLARF
ncbi:hypothetical protein [Synoicihabitans lomoniglobus]|uniref:Uncharacterized protein n=1 Tax=Synoicihabitans lomoniglobus TaxID=2909285 RepID=A0AAF0I5A9_9BACT|nr:hypothetical protein [Opitutaceae bacterium LMO-M01]WED66945.1 hypothetical protein PXH66_08795 [Opitutaceae bacterium LMO-M01]